jgi:hypothetical protein
MTYAYRTKAHTNDQDLNDILAREVFFQEANRDQRNGYSSGAQEENVFFASDVPLMPKVVWSCQKADGKTHPGKLQQMAIGNSLHIRES